MKHRARPWHDANHPVHVTVKVRPGLPSLRGHRLAAVIWWALHHASTDGSSRAVERRERFRVCHYSIQSNHIHFLVEASSKRWLSRGLQGLLSGLARRINRRLGRRGALFLDRFHAHELASPTEVRRALVYVLNNHRKHGASRALHDDRSSAPWFDGWSRRPPAVDAPRPVARAATWLLSAGWQLAGGLVRAHEPPGERELR
jgi:REP element-mobilizing transposase RayT